MSSEAIHTLSVELPWSLWLTLSRFCRYHGYDEAEYIAWLLRHASGQGARPFPLPSVFDSRGLQSFDEA